MVKSKAAMFADTGYTHGQDKVRRPLQNWSGWGRQGVDFWSVNPKKRSTWR